MGYAGANLERVICVVEWKGQAPSTKGTPCWVQNQDPENVWGVYGGANATVAPYNLYNSMA